MLVATPAMSAQSHFGEPTSKSQPAEAVQYATVSFDRCSMILDGRNYKAEAAWVGGYLSAVSLVRGDALSEVGDLDLAGIMRKLARICVNDPGLNLYGAVQALIPLP